MINDLSLVLEYLILYYNNHIKTSELISIFYYLQDFNFFRNKSQK